MNDMNHLEAASQALLCDNGIGIAELEATLAKVMAHRADFADLYLQASRSESWSMENGQVKSGSFGTDQGFGLRAMKDDETAFAYSQLIDAPQLLQAAGAVRSVASHGAGRIAISPSHVSRSGLYLGDDLLSARDAASKIALLNAIDHRARALDPRVTRVMASLRLGHTQILVMRHDGRLGADVRPMIILQMEVYVSQSGHTESCSGHLGGRAGFDLLSEDSIDTELRRVVNNALVKLEASPAPSGSMPVVIGPGWPGMLLHEAMGHGFEGDFNRLGTSVYAGRIGERIAHPSVNIVDDATLVGRRGSLHLDDEGEPGQRTQLIENGVLRGYMHDSLSARLMKQAPTGNGRRESYASLPMPRMTNTFMLAGEYEPGEIIASVKRGLYLADLGGGQVDIVSGQYSFECELAYLIEDGKLTRPIKGATVTGNGPDTLRQISMAANDLALDNGGATCGKFGQSVPVCVGQPTLRVDSLVVGGFD